MSKARPIPDQNPGHTAMQDPRHDAQHSPQHSPRQPHPQSTAQGQPSGPSHWQAGAQNGAQAQAPLVDDNRWRRYRITFMTLFSKEVMRFSRIWVQTILPSAITTTLYFVIFGRLIGERIGPMEGLPYIDFIVPGLVLMAVITNAYSNVVSSFYSSKFSRYIEELLVSPAPNWIILAGYVSGGVARGLTVGIVVMIVAAFFTSFGVHDIGVTLLILLLTAILFALGGFINAVYANSFDDISIVPTFVLAPLTYLGGVFYSIDLLPEPWQTLSLANPILYMINAFRYGLLGVSDIPLGIAFSIIALFIVVLGVYSLSLLRRGVGIKQ